MECHIKNTTISGSNPTIGLFERTIAYLLILNTCSIACMHTSLLWPIDLLTADVRAMRCRDSWRLDVQCRLSLPCKIWPCPGLWFLKASRVAELAVGYTDILIQPDILLASVSIFLRRLFGPLSLLVVSEHGRYHVRADANEVPTPVPAPYFNME